MFTGIVERVGTITDTQAVSGGKRLSIDVGPLAALCTLGASVCISGVCLTVAKISEPILEFDVITETLEKSTLGLKKTGDGVNLELSLRVGDRLDGHFVQGHVDGTATVARVDSSADEYVLWLTPQTHLQRYIIPKGSVSVDGVSLTIAEVDGKCFSVALIPTTLERTTLSSLSNGDCVNIESDMITRTIVHQLMEISNQNGINLESIMNAGSA